jgi:predicted nucleic acid-binding protein
MAEILVVNSSPIIFLSRSRHWDLLDAIAHRILIPRTVAEELLARGDQDPAARQLRSCSRAEILPVASIPASVEMWGLGPGESSVIALACTMPGAVAVIDDLAGRKCATAMGLRVRGTLGIVLLAKQRGAIPSARDVMSDLILSGMYHSRGVLDRALARVGE